MKRLIFIMLAILPAICSYGQVTLTVDSLDFSRTTETVNINDHGAGFQLGDEINPRIRIIATIKNHSEKDIYVFYSRHHKVSQFMKIRYSHQGNTYYQILGWKNFIKYVSFSQPATENGLWLKPKESADLELWAFLPSQANVERKYLPNFFSTYPLGFDWGKEEKYLTDADYLAWFKEILPKMKIIVSYAHSPFPWKVHEVISDPIDFETVVVTSSLTDKKIINGKMLKDIRAIENRIKDLMGRDTGHVPN